MKGMIDWRVRGGSGPIKEAAIQCSIAMAIRWPGNQIASIKK